MNGKHLIKVLLASVLFSLFSSGLTHAKPTDQPLTFWVYSTNGEALINPLVCALNRIRAATCLPVNVSLDAAHFTRFKPKADMGGRTGWTTGSSWDAARIALIDTASGNYACNLLVHEIGQHVLRRSNGHIGGGANVKLSAAVVDGICAVQSCPCNNPEP